MLSYKHFHYLFICEWITYRFFLQRAILFLGKKEITDDEKKTFFEAYDFVEKFLEGKDYVAGNTLSIADFSFVSTMSNCLTLVPFEPHKYPNITAWWNKMQNLPYYQDANVPGLTLYQNLIQKKMKE